MKEYNEIIHQLKKLRDMHADSRLREKKDAFLRSLPEKEKRFFVPFILFQTSFALAIIVLLLLTGSELVAASGLIKKGNPFYTVSQAVKKLPVQLFEHAIVVSQPKNQSVQQPLQQAPTATPTKKQESEKDVQGAQSNQQGDFRFEIKNDEKKGSSDLKINIDGEDRARQVNLEENQNTALPTPEHTGATDKEDK